MIETYEMEEEQRDSALLFRDQYHPFNNTMTTTCQDSHALFDHWGCSGGGAAASSQTVLFQEVTAAAGLMATKPEIWPLIGNSKNPPPAQHRVLAERKRREKLSQRFIALAALLPGLHKMNRASILEDAIKYIKQVQERVEQEEEMEKKKKTTIESAILIKKSHLYDCDDDEKQQKTRISGQKLPEIEVKISEQMEQVLVRIHCEKQDGLLGKLLGEMEDLNLTILNANVFPFATSTQYMVFLAQIDSKLSIKSKELVRKFEDVLLKFISTKQ